MNNPVAATLLLMGLLQNVVILQCRNTVSNSGRRQGALMLCMRSRCGSRQSQEASASKQVSNMPSRGDPCCIFITVKGEHIISYLQHDFKMHGFLLIVESCELESF